LRCTAKGRVPRCPLRRGDRAKNWMSATKFAPHALICKQGLAICQGMNEQSCPSLLSLHSRFISIFFSHKQTKQMYLRVYVIYKDSRDTSRQPAPSPFLCYSLTHAHRSVGYRNRNPQPLTESDSRLMYLRVYDSRDTSRQSVCTLPVPILPTHTYTQVHWLSQPQPPSSV
jgi:hypothetical protein